MNEFADNIKNQILVKSVDLGFDDLKVASAEPLGADFNFYKEWIKKGFHADMTWMEKGFDRRENPENILPAVKSVIVTATNYYTPKEYNQSDYRISRYAWGTDYHEIIQPKLKMLGRFISEILPGTEFRPYVDTGPVLEKVWAAKSGIGWIGRHGLVIHPRFGSWVFLGILLTTAELEPDKPVNNRCGKCTRCMEACPTGAILSDSIIDSNKCLSYWTIESKTNMNFPEKIIDNCSGWAFGCDTCQDACPWNGKLAKITSESLFEPRFMETNFNPESMKLMTNDEFRQRFRKSPVKRRKLEGIIHNIELLKKR